MLVIVSCHLVVSDEGLVFSQRSQCLCSLEQFAENIVIGGGIKQTRKFSLFSDEKGNREDTEICGSLSNRAIAI